jgi:hypothetical protein
MKKTIYFIILLSGILALSAFTGKETNVDVNNPLSSNSSCTNTSGMQEKLACESCHGGTAAQNGPIILVYEGGKMSNVGSVIIPGEHQVIIYSPEHNIQDLSTRIEEQLEVRKKSNFSHALNIVSLTPTAPTAAHQGFESYIKEHSVTLTLNNTSEEAINISNVIEGEQVTALSAVMSSAGAMNIKFSLGVAGPVNVILYNSNGQQLYANSYPQMQAGENQLSIPLEIGNEQGIGILQITGGSYTLTRKVLLKEL